MSHCWIGPNWPAPPGIRACSTLRRGGVSQGVYVSFNVAAHVGDDPGHVATNRQRLRSGLPLPAEPCWLTQVHGNKVVKAKANPSPPPNSVELSRHSGMDRLNPDCRDVNNPCHPWSLGSSGPRRNDGVFLKSTVLPPPPEADASFSDEPGVVCAVMTADCLPVLFCNRKGDRVAASHAGWRGLAGGVLESTVEALGSGDLMAWLGPAIGPQAFEVGAVVRQTFLERLGDCSEAFVQIDEHHWLADLYSLARMALARVGVSEVYGGDECTFSNPERFFSYRRDSQTGRMATLIWRE